MTPYSAAADFSPQGIPFMKTLQQRAVRDQLEQAVASSAQLIHVDRSVRRILPAMESVGAQLKKNGKSPFLSIALRAGARELLPLNKAPAMESFEDTEGLQQINDDIVGRLNEMGPQVAVESARAQNVIAGLNYQLSTESFEDEVAEGIPVDEDGDEDGNAYEDGATEADAIAASEEEAALVAAEEETEVSTEDLMEEEAAIVEAGERDVEAEAAADTLNDFQGAVETVNEEGGFADEAAVEEAEVALEAIAAVYNTPAVKLSYEKADNGKLLVSTEAIDQMRGNLVISQENIAKRALAALLRRDVALYNAIETGAFMLGRLMKKVADTPSQRQPRKAEVVFNMSMLHRNGELPTDLAGYLIGYAQIAEYVNGSFVDVAKDSYQTNIGLVSGLNKITDVEFQRRWSALPGKWRDPRSALTEAQLQYPVPGGRRMFENKSTTYDGPDRTTQFLDKYASFNIPTRMFEDSDGTRVGRILVPVLPPEKIGAITRAFLKVAQGFSRKRSAMEYLKTYILGTAGAAIYNTAVHVLTTPGFQGDRDQRFYLKRALKLSSEMRYRVTTDNMRMFKFILYSYNVLARKMLKQYS